MLCALWLCPSGTLYLLTFECAVDILHLKTRLFTLCQSISAATSVFVLLDATALHQAQSEYRALADVSLSALCCHSNETCTDCKSAQQSTTGGHPLPFPQVTSGSVKQHQNVASDRQTHTQTDTHVRDKYTFLPRLSLTRNVVMIIIPHIVTMSEMWHKRIILPFLSRMVDDEEMVTSVGDFPGWGQCLEFP